MAFYVIKKSSCFYFCISSELCEEIQRNKNSHTIAIALQCVVPEKIHTHPMEGHWKFLGGGGVLKVKFLEEMYENKLGFARGCKTKNLP